jgi:SET domain-containing protein
LILVSFIEAEIQKKLTNIAEHIDLDALYYGNKARFINHRQKRGKPNVCWLYRLVRYARHMRIHATRDIKAGDELFVNYGSGYVQCLS